MNSHLPPVIVMGMPGATPSNIEYTEGRMAALEDAAEQFFGQRYEIEGFTLFEHIGRGWQMSIRPKGEVGWIIRILPDEQAKGILDILATDPRFDEPRKTLADPTREPHRIVGVSIDGPFFGFAGEPEVLLARMGAAEVACRAFTAAILAQIPR